MKITMCMIRDFLEKDIIKEQIRTDQSDGVLESVSIFEPKMETSPDKIYIVEKRYFRGLTDLPHPGAFLFAGDAQSDIPTDIQNDYLVVSQENTALILQKLQGLFEKYRSWEIALYRAAMQKKGIKKIAMTAASLIRNPFFLYTSSLKLIFCCNLTKEAEIFFREREDFDAQIEGSYVTDSFLDKLKSDPERWKTVKETNPEINTGASLGYRTLTYNIFVGGIYVARLLICETQYELTNSDFFVLKTLGDFLRPFLEREDMAVNAHSVNFDKYIQKLLAGEHVDEAVLKPVLNTFGWNEKDRYFCCYIYADVENVAADLMMSTCFFLEVTCPNSAVITFRDHIVHIINLTAMNAPKDKVQKILARLYRERHLEAGCSPEFAGIQELSVRYRQAEAAYVMGSRAGFKEGYYLYEDYRLEDLLRIVTNRYSLEAICPKEICKLMEYDRANDMQLTLTLRTYLKYDRNIAKSIRVLYMQRSTFLYQLKRVVEITDLDLDDYVTRLYLQLYFAAEEMENS